MLKIRKKSILNLFLVTVMFVVCGSKVNVNAAYTYVKTGNTFETANSITVNNSVRYCADFKDLFKHSYNSFTITKPGVVAITTSTKEEIFWTLYDSEKNEIAHSSLEKSPSITIGLPKGTYVIDFESTARPTYVRFTVDCVYGNNIELEPNNSFDKAQQIELNKVYMVLGTGLLDYDYYSINLEAGKKYAVTFVGKQIGSTYLFEPDMNTREEWLLDSVGYYNKDGEKYYYHEYIPKESGTHYIYCQPLDGDKSGLLIYELIEENSNDNEKPAEDPVNTKPTNNEPARNPTIEEPSINQSTPDDNQNPLQNENESKVISESTMYRLYNPYSGEHFYTAEIGERDALVQIGWQSEGIAWNAPQESNTPVYRLYNPNSGEHHYTTGEGERDYLTSIGWNYEGIGWYSDDAKGAPLYRLYNPNAKGEAEAGAHHYTKDAAERDYLVSIGWNSEGIGWYGK